ncbi:Signal transduction histidine kinase [Micromonospora phaseoli]|uniref:histidine kinase n=1 Tax=Micromonospora phaseoli TaxID=1144548 RepID=A0A1H6YLY5_9ACTN|nr:sensor histidine kinase [Micromonospora phaseoli]PZW00211.1 signal transduction histidine kinase [Micromonospora phaseoli]GIJ78918.1 two-component sensor histidine kinase [Micromonospora phaseoli]SEJ40844.1 Signal transduction histidine kinase [Micromonospora phaseoli]
MGTELREWLRGRPLAGDALLAAGLVLAEVLFTLLTPREFWPRPLPTALGWSVLCAAPVALRRVAPWPAVLAALATLALPVTIEVAPTTQSLTFVVLTYTMAAFRPVRSALVAAVALWAPVAAVNTMAPPEDVPQLSTAFLVVNNLLVGIVSFSVGRTVHARRSSTEALRERARTAEANQRALAEQAVADERRRIARELHDVVAHHVSVMGVLATGVRRVLRRDLDAADEAIGTIEETSRATLRELRRLLDVLRTEAEPAAELAPQPGIAGIEALTEQVREAGLPVTLTVEGTPGPLEEGEALTVYRIVQEALTNALKHAGTATAQVRVSFVGSAVEVEVTDTGRGPSPDTDRIGHGLVGMRERVGLYGGVLRTGGRTGGGYRVYARIPVEPLADGGKVVR